MNGRRFVFFRAELVVQRGGWEVVSEVDCREGLASEARVKYLLESPSSIIHLFFFSHPSRDPPYIHPSLS